MFYGDLRYAKSAYEEGHNITSLLKERFGLEQNSPEIIEIAYDLQAGSYVDSVKKNRDSWEAYTGEIASILSHYCAEAESVLDVGTGEMTTLAGVAKCCYKSSFTYYACDISLSRLIKGKRFVAEELPEDLVQKINPFVADLFYLPFVDSSIDVIWTSHALEPNGGREELALAELLRVAKKKLILFEPYYEGNSPDGKARMDRLGYIKGLPEFIKECGATCEDIVPLDNISNPLNPTYAFIITPPAGCRKEAEKSPWACPATKLPMEKVGNCYWSEYSMLAYPILQDVPVFRREAAILASALK
ncbi:Methyltransferase domain-containing protein [Malonomonas rubra DSM 5091]|uniref:Methyltransferase domain-containing protein n=1 Tax=Malonomonas rubra DSM 5091 TaxID=1122189 RepID=A0A1M6M9Z9_MALRU|nr:class I SAM-dependent methyltransferase [Malonomonas rubra]SHJ80298.1 Methyltransferase domain-containing protein [Malonomonas rubra DSM 5091]